MSVNFTAIRSRNPNTWINPPGYVLYTRVGDPDTWKITHTPTDIRCIAHVLASPGWGVLRRGLRDIRVHANSPVKRSPKITHLVVRPRRATSLTDWSWHGMRQ